jgi:site-specific DNA recombinase
MNAVGVYCWPLVMAVLPVVISLVTPSVDEVPVLTMMHMAVPVTVAVIAVEATLTWTLVPLVTTKSLPLPGVRVRVARTQRLWAMAETMSAAAIAKALAMPEIAVRRAISDDHLKFYQAKRIDADSLEVIPCEWEPCMTAEQSLRIRAGRRSRKNLHGQKAEYALLLTNLGLLYCGRTIKTWHNSRIRSDGTRLDYYGCQKKSECTGNSRLIQAPQLETAIITNLFNALEDIAALQEAWTATHTENGSKGKINALQKSAKQLQTKKERLVRAVAEGVIEFADARRQMDALQEQLASTEAEIKTLIVSTDNMPPDWDALALPDREFRQLDSDDQRAFTTAAIERVEVRRNDALITYRFPMTQSGNRESRLHLPESSKSR